MVKAPCLTLSPADESSGPLWSPPRGCACLAERLGRAAGNVRMPGGPWGVRWESVEFLNLDTARLITRLSWEIILGKF